MRFLEFCVLHFANSFLTAAAEVAPAQDDAVTSPVRNLQKKTDLFQLQKVLFLLLYIIRFKTPLEKRHNPATIPSCFLDVAGDE